MSLTEEWRSEASERNPNQSRDDGAGGSCWSATGRLKNELSSGHQVDGADWGLGGLVNHDWAFSELHEVFSLATCRYPIGFGSNECWSPFFSSSSFSGPRRTSGKILPTGGCGLFDDVEAAEIFDGKALVDGRACQTVIGDTVGVLSLFPFTTAAEVEERGATGTGFGRRGGETGAGDDGAGTS